ncbi:MAG: NADH-quinone oxidoreductase subunit L [Trueperaceae bacterium]
MNLVEAAAYAPLLALIGAVINGFFGRALKEPAPGIIGSLAIGAGFVLSVLAFFGLRGMEEPSVHVPLWNYLSAGNFNLELGFHIDSLSVVLMMVITGVGFLIHVYSISYMHADDSFSRYFMALNLFVASMLILVMSDNYLMTFMGWEGVGVCSYLLIGFWYTQRENPDAARKAFIVNRIGDVGFLIAMFLVFKTFGTLNITQVNEAASAMVFAPPVITTIGLFFLLAACGKSAQLPLHTWLPDAMAGPTPVSALIHAATMVTAGVYLIARSSPIFALTPVASATVAWVGALTALIAAFAALTQTDIKKILAYSTISQLGFMFVAVGSGAYWVGIFHVFTHAFFKALLFLTSGSVIHAMGGEQDIRKMGGLGKHMKVTGTTALIGTLAIAGVPFLAGFFSKDAILAHVFNSTLIEGYGNYLLYGILLVTAVMTAFYMFRWYHCVFAGEERFGKDVRSHLHEGSSAMTFPLMILAVLSIGVGYLGLPEFAFPNPFAHWLEHSTAKVDFHHPAISVEWLLIGVSILAAAIGLGLGYYVYQMRKGEPVKNLRESALAKLSLSGLGFDALYRNLFTRTTETAASGMAAVDKEVLDKGIVSGAAGFGLLGETLRWLQSGFARAYALSMFVGIALIVLVIAFGGLR